MILKPKRALLLRIAVALEQIAQELRTANQWKAAERAERKRDFEGRRP